MAVYSLYHRQLIPCAVAPSGVFGVWSFFADPANLPLITPPAMQFRILSPPQGDRIYAGQLIEYKLRPLPFMRAHWLTEITHVSEGRYFVDEQRRGPYSLWHHQHHFKEIYQTPLSSSPSDLSGSPAVTRESGALAGLGVSDTPGPVIGVEMTDIVHYAIPFGFIGSIANHLLVARQLDAIFRYRRQRVEEIFGKFLE